MTSTTSRADEAHPPPPHRSHRPPGTVPPARFRPRFHYELLTCGLRGHELLGTDAAALTTDDAGFDPAIVVRETGGPDGGVTLRWHRCLRCDSWIPLDPPDAPTSATLPTRAEVDLPLRGRALRDRFVLRLIAIDRVVHFIGLALVAVAIFVFLADRDALRTPFFAVLGTLRDTVGIGDGDDGVVGELTRAFSASATTVVIVGIVVAAYALLEGVEAVGLWRVPHADRHDGAARPRDLRADRAHHDHQGARADHQPRRHRLPAGREAALRAARGRGRRGGGPRPRSGLGRPRPDRAPSLTQGSRASR
jgi:hypothetical protein